MTALPTIVVIGAMKCGTSALHRYLQVHPDVWMSEPKELNFFIGPATGGDDRWTDGNWHRGVTWYASHFNPDYPVRGEASPGYTSPAHPDAAGRMAGVIPHARLLYLVRDPVARAVSQYGHHRADGAEHRPIDQALLDPASQYIARGRYAERLQPFLAHYPAEDVLVVAQEELLTDRRRVLRSVYEFVGADPAFWADVLEAEWHTGSEQPPAMSPSLRQRLAEQLADDADRLRALVGREFPGWTV